MKIPFALLYTFNLLRTNLIKTIACILVAVVAPFLNSLISNMTNIKSCPVWKTKTQNRASKLEEIGAC